MLAEVDDAWGPKVGEDATSRDRATASAKAEFVIGETRRQTSWLHKTIVNHEPTWRLAKWHRLAARRRTRHLDNVVPRTLTITNVGMGRCMVGLGRLNQVTLDAVVVYCLVVLSVVGTHLS